MARRTPAQTAAAFWDRVTECGGQPAPGGAYINDHTAVALICAAGHPRSPRPLHVLQGKGICRRGAGQDPAAAAFWIRVAERRVLAGADRGGQGLTGPAGVAGACRRRGHSGRASRRPSVSSGTVSVGQPTLVVGAATGQRAPSSFFSTRRVPRR